MNKKKKHPPFSKMVAEVFAVVDKELNAKMIMEHIKDKYELEDNKANIMLIHQELERGKTSGEYVHIKGNIAHGLFKINSDYVPPEEPKGPPNYARPPTPPLKSCSPVRDIPKTSRRKKRRSRRNSRKSQSPPSISPPPGPKTTVANVRRQRAAGDNEQTPGQKLTQENLIQLLQLTSEEPLCGKCGNVVSEKQRGGKSRRNRKYTDSEQSSSRLSDACRETVEQYITDLTSKSVRVRLNALEELDEIFQDTENPQHCIAIELNPILELIDCISASNYRCTKRSISCLNKITEDFVIASKMIGLDIFAKIWDLLVDSKFMEKTTDCDCVLWDISYLVADVIRASDVTERGIYEDHFTCSMHILLKLINDNVNIGHLVAALLCLVSNNQEEYSKFRVSGDNHRRLISLLDTEDAPTQHLLILFFVHSIQVHGVSQLSFLLDLHLLDKLERLLGTYKLNVSILLCFRMVVQCCEKWDARVYNGSYIKKCIPFAKSSNKDYTENAVSFFKALRTALKERFGKELFKKIP